jgi:hypothetical protein
MALPSNSTLRCLDLGQYIGAIFRLKKVGRRYLIEDGSSISKGVDVLSECCEHNTNCVFLHPLENPILCYRSVVYIVSTDESNSSTSTNSTVSNGEGKPEQASVKQNHRIPQEIRVVSIEPANPNAMGGKHNQNVVLSLIIITDTVVSP